MSLLTTSLPIVRENLGSLTYIQIGVNTVSNNDTYSLGVSLPVVNVDVTGNSTTSGVSNAGDATYNSSTGLITIVSPNQGSIDLIIYMRN